MKRITFAKRIIALSLSLIMVMSVMPLTAYADGTYTFPSYSQSGNNTSTLRYYLTDENAGNITIEPDNNRPVLRLNLDDGWYFEKWDTYFNGYKDKPIQSDPAVEGSNPVSDEGHYTFFNLNQNQPFSNVPFLYIAIGTNLYGDHKVTAVFKPIVTVNADDSISYTVTTNSPTTVSSNQTAVKYQDDVTITYTVDSKYVLTDVNASGTKTINIDKANSRVILSGTEKPTSVGIHARLKQQNVNFDANGGESTMAAQVFEHSVAQTLPENSFTKIGYTFAGWNTKADSTGTTYTDKQSVTFAPDNDGDSITLYAQWTECTNHQWVDGECTECGTLCSHSGGSATCTKRAECEVCGEEYGNLAEHTYGTEWKSDGINHWHECSCGAKSDEAAHDWSGWVLYDANSHYRFCQGEGCDEKEIVSHFGGEATCTEKAECTACGEEYGELVAHTYGTEWKSDGQNHWHECSCGAKSDEAAHTYGDDTCEAPATCSECGATTGSALGHKDENTDHICDRGCGKTDMGIHGDTDADHVCDYGCSAAIGTHTSASGKHTCDYCGNAVTACTDFAEVVKPEALKSATDCTNPAVYYKSCTVCGANGTETFTSGEIKGHTYENGKCTVCQAVDPNYVPETGSPQTGDNSNLALWFTLLFISGSVLITVTACDRKRRMKTRE